jgi:hypothetical protein
MIIGVLFEFDSPRFSPNATHVPTALTLELCAAEVRHGA